MHGQGMDNALAEVGIKTADVYGTFYAAGISGFSIKNKNKIQVGFVSHFKAAHLAVSNDNKPASVNAVAFHTLGIPVFFGYNLPG